MFEAQGEAHADIDMRLVDAIESVIAPKLGAWDGSERWWQKTDFYGDGIRSLAFASADFSPDFVTALRQLLTGEHAEFCILCQVHRSLSGPVEATLGCVAIRADAILVSYPLVELVNGEI